ncbi:MAG: AAA family ATPase, partial [Ruminococcus sp.]|nr:AAA family ATPase [Ruminococcus sp.]
MKEFKPIPIGVEDFKEIIDKGSYYVDKTDMIQELLDSNAKVNLFTRPRRFGKTLNISMLQRFFEKTDEDNAYL